MAQPGTYGLPILPADPPAPVSGVIFYYVGSTLRYQTPTSGVVQLSVTQESIEDIVGNLFQDSSSISFSYDDALNSAQVEVVPLGVNHQALSGAGTNTHAQIDSHIASILNPHGVTKAQVGLGNVDNTSDASKPVSTAQSNADTAVQSFSIQRSNHTGTQLANTISNFAATVLATVLAGISFANSNLVTAADSILVSIGKLQAQINLLIFGREAEDFIDTTQVNFSGGIALRRSYTTAVKPVGRYRVGVLIQHEPASTGSNDFFELRVNGVNISLLQEDEAKDTGGDIRRTNYLFGYYQHPASGTFDIEVWGGNQSGTTELNGSIAEVWRVS